MKRLLINIFLCGQSLLAFSQTNFTISGLVVDKITQESLPSANIVYIIKSIGTTSDEYGRFKLNLNSADIFDSISISYTGYKPYKTSISELIKAEKIELQRDIQNLKEVIVRPTKKLNIKHFMNEVISKYWRNKNQDSHIALSYYRENIKSDNRNIMFVESIGYTIYAALIKNASPFSNYNFYAENSKYCLDDPQWLKLSNQIRNMESEVTPASGACLRFLRYLETDDLLSLNFIKKYKFSLDSNYRYVDEIIYKVYFTYNKTNGFIHINADNLEILLIECASYKFWSSVFSERVKANVKIQFCYFNSVPYIKAISAYYQKGNLEHVINMEILQQKFDKFNLSENEYWSLNDYNLNPFLTFNSKDWKKYLMINDPDYSTNQFMPECCEKFLDGNNNYTDRWFSDYIIKNEVARQKIKSLKMIF